MSLSMAIPAGAKVIAGAVLGGAIVGGGIGAVQSLRQKPTDDGISRMERRNALANAIVGAGIGAAAGAGIMVARKFVPALGTLPVIGAMSGVQALALGGGAVATSVGAYSLAKAYFD